MHKKSQIAYFLLFSLIILIVGGFYFYINNQSKAKEGKIERSSEVILDAPSIASSVKIYVESCFDSSAENGTIYERIY